MTALSRCCLLLVCFATASGGLAAQQSGSPARRDLASRLTPLIEQHRGDVGVMVKHLGTGEEFAYRSEAVMPTASLCKLAVMVATYRAADAGRIDLQQVLTLSAEDKVPGSGILTEHFTPGACLPLRDAVRLMMAWSDNTATNLVLDAIGLQTTAETMGELGLPNTKIHSKVYRASTSIFPDRSRRYGLGSTTARETVSLLQQLHTGSVASEASCAAMMAHLRSCEDQSKLAARLPAGIRLAHKSGAVGSIRCDAGIMDTPRGAIAICVLTNNNKDKTWGNTNAGNKLCADIAWEVFGHFNPPHGRGSSATGEPLRPGAFGSVVEMLQRTLNAKLTPSPDLSVDGDFGPATEQAVRRFQEQHALAATGVVDAATWAALGALLEEHALPDPHVVNSAVLPRIPADEITGPPFVTCRAYAVIDDTNGQLLLGKQEESPLAPASTTKIMTAWLVLRLSEDDPGVLDEVLTFSDRADATRGSTSGLRSGEQLPVREALYGLLLPSGNDMAVALAEHFGSRLAPGDASPDPLDRFVTAMNAEADRLQLSATRFRNPHGLPADGHVSSAMDLAQLARTAWRDPLFRQYASTRQRGVQVEGAGGYRRNLVWKNTNRLLEIDGYEGVKTGTTTAAGACLVSCAVRDGRRLFLATLGSACSEARYADSRNLYRHAWRRLSADQSNSTGNE